MKWYIRSATLLELKDVIRQRLSVPGVRTVEITEVNSRFARVKLHYDDGSVSDNVVVQYKNQPDRSEALTSWNPGWKIRDDGAVIAANGTVVGWFKLLKKKPQTAAANYIEDSLVVNYGTRSIALTETSGPQVAKIIKPD